MPKQQDTLKYLMYAPKPVIQSLLANVHTPDSCYVQLHGVWYDMKPFLARHPGGVSALMLGAGRDATALFESSHTFADKKKLDALLAKHKISNEEAQTLGLATLESGLLAAQPADFPGEYGKNIEWEFGGKFRTSIVNRVRKYFEEESERRGITLIQSTKATPEKWHVIGHHVHTNMPFIDPDLVHGTEVRREHTQHPLATMHIQQANVSRIAWHFLVGTWLGLGGINDMKLIFSPTRSYNGFIPRIPVTRGFLALHVVTRVAYFLAQFGWPFFLLDNVSFSRRLLFAFVPAMVYSALFMVNTQINHLAPSAMDPLRPPTRDWTVHQIVTAQNFGNPEKAGPAWWFHYLFSGGLNLQVEHHLFPTVNHCHLVAVSKIVKEECCRHGVQYNQVSGYLEGMREYVKHSQNMVDVEPFGAVKKS